jgi:hypothetical protein
MKNVLDGSYIAAWHGILYNIRIKLDLEKITTILIAPIMCVQW